jgi:Putative Ig domain
MLSVNQSFTIEEGRTKQVFSSLVLALGLISYSLVLSGCNAVPQSAASSSQASAQSAQHLSIQTLLPDTAVGSSYRQVLSVSGGRAPYWFTVSQGQLPPGLVLNSQTGSIAGAPTQAGNFAFTISVTGESTLDLGVLDSSIRPVGLGEPPLPSSGNRAYTLTITPCTECVSVQVSPATTSVNPSGKVQFTAKVSNTSNTAVTWSVSSGNISTTGLFTAPANASTKPITVTASSVAEKAVQASATVSILSSSNFRITTTSLPATVKASPYSVSLLTSGGGSPYQWGVVSGSLPNGIQLNASSGTLSGSATQSGVFTFTVRGTDGASQTAQQALTLDVSVSNANCGPPSYRCSRTDLDIVQVPAPPSVGNLSGANTIVTDPNFANRIVRITDYNTDPSSISTDARTFVSSTSGSADENLWNVDSTLLILQNNGGAAYPFTFDATTLQAARMYVSSYPASAGLKLSDDGTWSRVSPEVLYAYSSTAISKYDFSDRTTPPTSQPVFDFTSSRNCLPAGFSVTWKTKGGVSAGDAVFGMAYSNTGNQGSAIYAVAYKVGSGCTMLNTQTGQVTGDWGTAGAINIKDRWTIHNAKLSKDGNWLILSTQTCTSSNCSHGPYFWQIGTTNVSSCGDGGKCGGHFTEGYSHWINNDNSPLSNQVIRSFAESALPASITNIFPAGITTPFDQHQSWNNADPADSVPFLSSTWSTVSPFPAPWYNEIIAVASDGSGKTWRFAHSFMTGRSQRFSALYAIGSVSQDGRFFLFSSDWMGKLGSESGAATCTVGSDCRGDVFVVELR